MQDIPTKAKNLKQTLSRPWFSLLFYQRTQFSNLQKGSFFLQSSTSPSHSTTQFRLHSLTPKEELSASPTNSEVHALKAKGKEQRFSRQCLSSPETMEANGSSSNSNESQPSGGSNNSSTEKPNEKEIFVNHAEIAWHEKRREWVGDQSQRTRRMPREPIMSWTTTYEDLLLSTEPFQQPIPLAEMVDFLVDIWNEEGLYD